VLHGLQKEEKPKIIYRADSGSLHQINPRKLSCRNNLKFYKHEITD